MTGTIINVIAVIVGGTVGALLGNRLPQRVQQIVVQGVGLVVLALALDMALETKNILLVLGSMVIGGILGEWWQLDQRLNLAGQWLESKASRIPFLTRGDFTKGFVTASLVFCVGPMAILGSIQDGISGDYTLLTIKSVMDAFTALAFSAAMGMGVAFSGGAVLLVQGSISLGAGLVQGILTEPMIIELSATGGVILIGLGLLLLDIKQIRVANFLPALMVAPLLVWLWERFGVQL